MFGKVITTFLLIETGNSQFLLFYYEKKSKRVCIVKRNLELDAIRRDSRRSPSGHDNLLQTGSGKLS
jgi:hypothetical protein